MKQNENLDVNGRPRKKAQLRKDAIPTILSYLDEPIKKKRRNRANGSEDDQLFLKTEEKSAFLVADDHAYFTAQKDPREKPLRFSLTNDMVGRIVPNHNKVDCQLKDELEDLPLVKNPFNDPKVKEKIKHLEKQVESLKQELSSIKTVFNEDQRQRLKGSKKIPWSEETISESLKLRYACGIKGYEYLKSKGFPLPSLVVIEDHINELKVPSNILTECTSIMKLDVDSSTIEELAVDRDNTGQEVIVFDVDLGS